MDTPMGFPEKLQCWMIWGSDILGCRTKNNSCSPAKPGNKPIIQRRVFKTKDVLLLPGHQARIWWLSQRSRVIQLPKSGQAQRNVRIKSEGSPILSNTYIHLFCQPIVFWKDMTPNPKVGTYLGHSRSQEYNPQYGLIMFWYPVSLQ